MKHARELIVEELRKNKTLRLVHLQDAILSLFSGEKRVGLLMLRDIVNATCGFPKLAKTLSLPDKSVQRMLSVVGNPTTDNLMAIVRFIFTQENVEEIKLKRASHKKAA